MKKEVAKHTLRHLGLRADFQPPFSIQWFAWFQVGRAAKAVHGYSPFGWGLGGIKSSNEVRTWKFLVESFEGNID